jgi:hypothetical protein
VAAQDAEGVVVEAVLGQFSANRTRAVTAYRSFVEAGLPSGHREDFYAVSSQRLLGDERFVEKMEKAARGEKRMPPVAVSVEAITKRVARLFGVSEAHLRGRGRSREAARVRAVVAYLGREEASLSLGDVARYFRRDEATLSLGVLRLETQMALDPHLFARLTSLRRAIRRGASRKAIKQIIKA